MNTGDNNTITGRDNLVGSGHTAGSGHTVSQGQSGLGNGTYVTITSTLSNNTSQALTLLRAVMNGSEFNSQFTNYPPQTVAANTQASWRVSETHKFQSTFSSDVWYRVNASTAVKFHASNPCIGYNSAGCDFVSASDLTTPAKTPTGYTCSHSIDDTGENPTARFTLTGPSAS
ncbi:hypothetical protein OTB20_40935 [Streptomyces sp. H27-H1]|uniref:hypothetical protein n=1 Tax=Streptomyces sp. H27-H1 TaxID=2996461 RepID=UPI00226FB346|nr:hypothetical protein [Streptomyces sp. H27-H1]MCY0932406.1 hypothetical protein [Streptomyces sp. H27-H1]